MDLVLGIGDGRDAALGSGGEVSGSAAGRPRLRAGLDPRPGGAAPDRRQRGGRPALRPPGQLDPLRPCRAARRGQRAHAQSARAIRALGLCHLRRPAHRPAAHRRPGQHRAGAPTHPGPCLLAPEGSGGGPGDLERRPRRLPAGAAGPYPGPGRGGPGDPGNGAAGRHLRALVGADRRGGPHPVPDRRTGHRSATAAGPWRNSSTAWSRRWCACRAWSPPGSRQEEAAGRLRAAAARPDPGQRDRRVHPGRTRVRHHHHGPAAHPGALGERAGQSPVRQRRLRGRPGLYLGRERPRVPPHPLAQRPGVRPERRGLLPARRGERPVLVAHAPAPARCDALRQPARLRLQRVRAYRGRHPLGAVGLCRHGCAGQVLRAQGAQRLGSAAPAVRHRLRGMGAGRPAAEDGHAPDHRSRSLQRRPLRTQPLQQRVPRPGRLLRRGRRQPHQHLRPHRVHRPQRQPGASGGAGAHPPVRSGGQRARPLRRDPGALRPGRGAGARDRLPAGPGGHAGRRGCRLRWCIASAAPKPPGGPWRRSGTTGTTPSGRFRWKRPTSRSMCSPTAGCCTRPWPAGCGAAAATTSPAAPSASATSCRTPWPWCTPSRRLLRAQLLLCAGRQFPEGDVQHWWHPPSGRGVRSHCSDDYLWLALATCRYVLCTGDTGVLDEPVAFLAGRPLSPDDESYYDLPGRSRGHGEPLSALRAGHPPRARPGRRPRPAADGLRRLERRHEPGRHPGPGGERLAGLLPVRGAAPVRRPGPPAGRYALRRDLRRRRGAPAREPGTSRLGRRLVSPRLVRRRHAAGFGGQQRMPDRFDLPELGGTVRGGRSRTRAAWPCRRSTSGWCAASTA